MLSLVEIYLLISSCPTHPTFHTRPTHYTFCVWDKSCLGLALSIQTQRSGLVDIYLLDSSCPTDILEGYQA